MFHPGKVLSVYSPKDKNVKGENTTEATLEMWDENVITFLVASEISGMIKKGDIVLVDYRPQSDKYPFPRHVITKIHKDIRGKEAWKSYADFLSKQKGRILEKMVTKQQVKPSVKQQLHTIAG